MIHVFTFELLIKIGVAILLFFIVTFGFQALKKYLFRIIENTASLAGYTKRLTSLKYALAVIRVIVIFIYVIFLFVFFEIPGSTIVSFFGLVSVAVSLLLREILLDYVFGFLILLEGKIRIDDEVIVEGFSGTVEIIELRTTKIRDGINGDVLVISNRHFTKFIKKKSQRGFTIDAIIQNEDYDKITNKIKTHYQNDKNIKQVDVVIVRYNVDKLEIQVIVDAKNYTYNHLKQEILQIMNEV